MLEGNDSEQGHGMTIEGFGSEASVLVTGGTSGIGVATVRRFRQAGAHVVAVARKERPGTDLGGAHLVAADVSDEAQVRRAFQTATDLIGPLTAVVLNAGAFVDDGADLASTSAETLRELLEVNTLGVFHGLRVAPEHMRDGGSITITSTAALDWAFPGYLAYSASKAPLTQLCRHAAMLLGPRGIRVNTVSPGTIVTDMQPPDDDEAKIAQVATCLGRTGTPEDVAGVFLFLASDDAGYITGTDIRVDGGWLEGLTPSHAEAVLRGL
jgi:NAD(P)-dependent dehydrogenase (short-subunit alcohol dehydrogenase family)